MKPFDVYSLLDIELVRGSDVFLWDAKGNQYLDMYGGHAVISVGHSHPRYVQAITQQLNEIGFYSNSIQIPLQLQLAEKLGELSGYSDYSLFLCNSGAEANENALKLASFANGKRKVLAFEKSFHGRTSLAVAATDDSSIQAEINRCHDVQFLPLNDLQQLEQAFTEDFCAVIIEGIQGVGGIHAPSTEFLLTLRRLCTDHSAVLILDEVQSGYGRSGFFFAHQESGIAPDIITVAKGMGNGFPVAGCLISPSFHAKKGMLGTTFGGNHLACSAAIAVLDIIREEELISNAETLGTYILQELRTLPNIEEVRGRGLMIGVQLPFAVAECRGQLLSKHQILTGTASSKNVMRILPPLTLKKKEADYFLESLHEVLRSL